MSYAKPVVEPLYGTEWTEEPDSLIAVIYPGLCYMAEIDVVVVASGIYED